MREVFYTVVAFVFLAGLQSYLGVRVSSFLQWSSHVILRAARIPFGDRIGQILSFAFTFALFLGWAGVCWWAADSLAQTNLVNRWVLLLAACAYAAAPYWTFQRFENQIKSSMSEAEAALYLPPIAYAGGLQSKFVVGMIIAGYFFNLWEGLPG